MTDEFSKTFVNEATAQGRIPSLHIIGDSIPIAWYRAMKAVWEEGIEVRTEYDRVNEAGDFIDPPSRDARVLIEVKDPFAQPRFPPLSFCEIGTYIAEIMGVKDHLVLPMQTLRESIGGKLSATQWPYSYHQRLFAHPDVNGDTVDQIALAVQRVAKTPFTRRAMVTTSVPNIDPFLEEDVPCLREAQFRCPEDAIGDLILNVTATWRSRDLYKAWPDNVIGLTFLYQVIAKMIENLTDRIVEVGSYADFSMSLHIYGQDHGAVGGNADRGLASFFDTFGTEEYFVARCLTSEQAAVMLVIPQLTDLLSDKGQEQWHFPPESMALLHQLISQIESGEFTV